MCCTYVLPVKLTGGLQKPLFNGPQSVVQVHLRHVHFASSVVYFGAKYGSRCKEVVFSPLIT